MIEGSTMRYAGALVMAGTLLLAAPRASADARKDAAARVEAIARGLEQADPAARAKAAAELGGMFPEGAAAVPALVDAAHDDDDGVRRAAVVALRRLGSAGQAEAVAAMQTLDAGGLALLHDVGAVLNALGAAVTPTDFAVGLAEACTDRSDAGRAGLLVLATAPTVRWEAGGMWGDTLRDDLATLELARPWLASSQEPMARAAAATVAVLGRAAVSSLLPREPEEASTVSAPALVATLDSPKPAIRWMGWRLLAVGAPHGAATRAAIVKAWTALPPAKSAEGVVEFSSDAPLRIDRGSAFAALRTAGADAREAVVATVAAAPEGALSLAALLDVGAIDAARTSFAQARARWLAGANGDFTIDDEWVLLAGREPALAAAAAPDLPRLLDLVRTRSTGCGALLALVDPKAPPDPVPDDPETARDASEDPERAPAARCLRLAWLAQRVPADALGEGVRVRTAAALRRAIAAPGTGGNRQYAAALVADLDRADGVPAATLWAALQAKASQREPVQIALMHAMAAVRGVPPAAVSLLAAYAAKRPPETLEVSAGDRLRYAAGWPYVQRALLQRMLGAMLSVPEMRQLAAIDALGAVAGDAAKARAALEALLPDDDARVRYRAARALRRLAR